MQLSPIIRGMRDGRYRLSVIVEGESLWFESTGGALAERPEAFASAMLFASLRRRRALSLQQPVDKEWLKGVEQLQSIWSEWWDYPRLQPRAAECMPGGDSPAAGKALCFTGGVDSFYSLLKGGHDITHLMFVEGYDVGVAETDRLQQIRKSLCDVAKANGTELIVLSTNLRKHPAFAKARWPHAHGSALAAAGYLISDKVGELIIPSSYLHQLHHPWGSSSHTDHLWSTPFLKVTHDDASIYRFDKIRAIASEPLAQEHLRVCYQRRVDGLNCSACEKCVRTMIALDAVGMLRRFETFDRDVPLWKRIDGIPRIKTNLFTLYENLLERNHSSDQVAQAIERLLLRSKEPPRTRPWRRVLRAFRRSSK